MVLVYVVQNRTFVDSDWRFNYLCGSHLQSQSELYHVSWWHYTLVIDLIGQLRRDVIGRLSVKPWCYWLWRPSNSPIQDYVHRDGHAQPTYVQTQSVPTTRTLSTLHTVKNVLWPYRPYDCTDSAVVTDCLRRSNRKFSSNLSASSSGKAMHYWNIGDFFSPFQNLQVRCFVFSFSVWIFLALFLSCLYEYF